MRRNAELTISGLKEGLRLTTYIASQASLLSPGKTLKKPLGVWGNPEVVRRGMILKHNVSTTTASLQNL